MIGILVVTHGKLGRELINTVEMIVGSQKQMASVEIHHKDDMPTSAENIEKAFQKVNKKDGVIIFTDLLGGTPSNVSLTMLNRPKVEVMSGVNLPMLLKAVDCRPSLSLKEVVEASQKSGKDGITAATLILGNADQKDESGTDKS
jgi:PTS system mannose-specific IIA component